MNGGPAERVGASRITGTVMYPRVNRRALATAKQLGMLMEDDEIRGMALCGRLAMRLTCYYCGAEISTEAGQIGTLIVCPGCGHRVRVPRPGRAEASAGWPSFPSGTNSMPCSCCCWPGEHPNGKFGRLLKSFRFRWRLTRMMAAGPAPPRRCQGRTQLSQQPFFWRLIA